MREKRPHLAAGAARSSRALPGAARRGFQPDRNGAMLTARPLLPAELQLLQHQRYVVVPNWLDENDASLLRRDALEVDDHSGFDSSIGRHVSGTRRRDSQVRRSRQCSIIPPPSNSAGSVDVRADLITSVNALRTQLQESHLLALPQLEPFQTELNYLLYPVGGHYQRHLDQPYADTGWERHGRSPTDGGSYGGSRSRRVVSFLAYLNSGWDAADGGALRIFPAHQRVYGTEDSQLAVHAEDVLPEGGTLVVFMSGEVEHLVQETFRERQCVVGWFREHSSARVPDLGLTSLRTLRRLDRRATVGSCRGLLETGQWGWD